MPVGKKINPNIKAIQVNVPNGITPKAPSTPKTTSTIPKMVRRPDIDFS
ncbi:MAG: hypothetical protein ACJA1A_001424 [Saprospiraceae bacterium]|jgi:hypothetical protein|tara:strand:+ start:2601 stop:2747 length:147 start_codon:yes stop_codon:yes gene_type:complete